MAKKRGVGVGGSGYNDQGGGTKRKPNTPVGGVYKDLRRNLNSDDLYDKEEEWTEVVYSKSRSPPREEQVEQVEQVEGKCK